MTLRRVFVYTALLVVALLGGTYFALTRSGLARSLILDGLSTVFRARLQVGDTELDPIDGTVRIDNLRLTPPAKDGVGRQDVLKVPEVLLGVSMNPLSGPGAVRTIRIRRPELDLYLGNRTPLDLDSLFRLDAGAGAPDALPSLRIEDMTVRLHLPAEGDPALSLGPIQLTIRPEADRPRRLVLEGRCPNPLGKMIRIRGSGDLDANEFQLVAEADEFLLRADGMQAFGEAVARFVTERRLHGLVKPTLWLSYPDEDGGLGGGIRSTFSDFQVLPPAFTYLFTGLGGSASFTSRDHGSLEVRVDRSRTDLDLDAVFRISNIGGRDEVELRGNARNVPIDRKLTDALAGIPVARRVLVALEPRHGKGDLRIHIHSGVRADKDAGGRVPHTQLDLDLRDVDVRFAGFPRDDGSGATGFPYPLTGFRGKVLVRDDFVVIESFHGRGVHGGSFDGSGEVDLGRDQIDFHVEARKLPLTPHLRAAFAATVGGRVDPFVLLEPRGEIDVDLHLAQQSGAHGPTFDATVRPRGASAAWHGFPFRVDNLVGQVRVASDEIGFHLRGNRGPRTDIEIRGRFPSYDDPEHGGTELWVKAGQAELTGELREALGHLDPSFAKQWDVFSPRGRFDLDFLGWRAPGAKKLSFDLRADLAGARCQFEPFPVALHGIHGPVVLHGDGRETRVEIVGLRGRGLDARLLFRGSLAFRSGAAAAGPITDLSVIAKGVELNDELADVLADRGIVTREFWKLAKVSGTVDTILRIRRSAGEQDWGQTLSVDLRQIESKAAILPDTLTHLSGEVTIDDERAIHVHNLRGRIGESPVTCSAGKIWQKDGDTYLSLELGADRYPVDDRLANLLDGEVKRAYLERDARGEVSVAGLAMTLRVPGARPQDATGLGLSAEFHGGQFRAHGLAMNLGLRITDINGYVVLDEGRFDDGGSRFAGNLSGLTFVAFGQVLNDVRGPFVVTHESFTVPSGEARFHGGVLRSFTPAAVGGVPVGASEPLIHFDFGPHRHLDVDLELTEVNVEKLLRGLETAQHYSGLLNGQVRLGVDLVDPTTLRMAASFGVRDGYLGDVPVFRSIYRLLRPEKRPNFNAGLIVLETKDDVIEIRKLRVSSPLMRVEGKGTLRYDGYLDLAIRFPNLFPEASSWTILPGIYRVLADSLVSYDIVGYLGNLHTGARFVPFEGAPRRIGLAPLPGRAAKLPRIFR